MKIVDLSMTVEECDTNPFSPEDVYFKLTPIVRWEDKGFVSNLVEMTVHAGTHIDSPHHFVREKPGVEQIPLEPLIGEAIVLDLTFKGTAKARIVPEDLDRAERTLSAQGITIPRGTMLLLRTSDRSPRVARARSRTRCGPSSPRAPARATGRIPSRDCPSCGGRREGRRASARSSVAHSRDRPR
ncbi:MAG: hypothetical protein DME10_16225 [Candidatus Rokuibacteriota bacterium]|nr:MAG: hypothetical protein DME10_16225 [Candidatus Rokubacteria bacterium]